MNDRMAKAVADMRAGASARDTEAFALADNRFHKHERARKEWATRQSAQKFVKAENASELLAHLPAPGEITHAILRGDFVLGDALPALLGFVGPCAHLRVATLGLSVKNAETLRALVETKAVARVTLVCSHYFAALNKLDTFHAVCAVLAGVAEMKVARCHAKIICLQNTRGDAFVFEGSANLRSSATIEQLTIFNDAALHDFHSAWLDELRDYEPKPRKPKP